MSDRRPNTMLSILGASWALLLGFALLMLGDGLQGTLLGVRATLEGFAPATTGLIMSTFYLGFLGGSLLSPRMVEQVGHIRAFGALASLASAAILIHAVFVDPFAWAVLRLVSGFCLAGLYVVVESWLNDRATNESRGKLLSAYMLVTYAGVGGGQLLLNLADPVGFELFILTSVLISVALVPLLLSAGSAPHFAEQWQVKLLELYRISPLGVFGAVMAGMATAALFAMAPVYAQVTGMSVARVSLFMGAFVGGCIVLQWPIGHLSDVLDRRTVLTVTTFCAAAVAIAAIPAAQESPWVLLVVAALFGGLSLPLYSVCIAHANDHLEPEQMVAASGALVLASGIGAIVGPLASAGAMTAIGPSGMFWSLAAMHVALGVFAVYRMLRRGARPLSEQGHYGPTGYRSSAVALEWSQHATSDEANLAASADPE